MNCHGQSDADTDLPIQLGKAVGIYKLNLGTITEPGFEEFEFFRLLKFPGQDGHDPNVPANGLVFVDGFLETKGGTTYKFRKALFKRRSTGGFESMQFKTEEVAGVSYSFDGRFLEQKVQERPGGNYTKARGVLTRYAHGGKTTSRTLPYYEFAEL